MLRLGPSSGWEAQILASLVKSPLTAEVSYRVMLHSVLVGDIRRGRVHGAGARRRAVAYPMG